MIYKFIISGTLIDLNKYINLNRAHYHKAAAEKIEQDSIVYYSAKEQIRDVIIEKPVGVRILWIEPNDNRDSDNVAFAIKFILDGLVHAGVLPEDKRKNIKFIYHDFETDSKNPRIEVTLEEVNENRIN